MNKKVSIIMRCRDNWKVTKRAIDSIIENTPSVLYELIVVNDGSKDETIEELTKLETNKKLISLHHINSKGAVSASNTGLKYVFKNPTPYVMIMDNDIEILKGNTTWLSDMIAYFDEDESLGILGACSNNVIGLQHVSDLTNNAQPKFLISFCWMMSLRCVKKVGLMDELFNPMSGEDLDYSIRATRNGFTLKVAKDVYVNHYCHQTLNKHWDVVKLTNDGERKLLSKWGELIYYSTRQ